MSEEIHVKYSLDRNNLQKTNDQEIIARIDIEPDNRLINTKDLACDFILVMDASSSMDEPFSKDNKSLTKREGAIEAAKSILDHLGSDDTVSLIFFDSQAYIISTAQSAYMKTDIANNIDELKKYYGSTNFQAALEKSKRVLESCKNPIRRLLFLTDGSDNQSDMASVDKLVHEIATQSVAIDCMGLGSDFDFEYMRNMSHPSNGFTELLDSPSNAAVLFQNFLINTQRTLATKVFLGLRFPADGIRKVEIYQQFPEIRYHIPKSSENGDYLNISVYTLRRDKRNVYLVKARVDAPIKGNTSLIMEITLDYDIPALNLEKQRVFCNVYASYSDTQTNTIRDTSINDLYYEAELSKLYEEFLKFKDDDWRRADNILQEMIKRAESLGNNEKVDFYQSLRNKLQKDQKLSNDDLNRLGHSSTRSTQQALADISIPIDNLDY